MVTMLAEREDNFFKTCTDKQVLACAYAIKGDKEEGNLTRATQTFGRTFVNEALFGEYPQVYNPVINTYNRNTSYVKTVTSVQVVTSVKTVTSVTVVRL